ncbi:hypothetical protein [Helicobacter suis]|nr:hypothetical protein [Helicobacter suis]
MKVSYKNIHELPMSYKTIRELLGGVSYKNMDHELLGGDKS